MTAVLAGESDGDGRNLPFNGHPDITDVTADDKQFWQGMQVRWRLSGRPTTG